MNHSFFLFVRSSRLLWFWKVVVSTDVPAWSDECPSQLGQGILASDGPRRLSERSNLRRRINNLQAGRYPSPIDSTYGKFSSRPAHRFRTPPGRFIRCIPDCVEFT